jgi:hypothetical protein
MKNSILWIAISVFTCFTLTDNSYAAIELHEKVILDGEVRVRGEHRDNDTYTTGDDSSQVILQRTRLGLRIYPIEKTTGYIRLQDSRTWGDTDVIDSDTEVQATAKDDDDESFDLKEGYLLLDDLIVPSLSLTVGRQLLSYGDQRMLGGFDWDNFGFSHDAVKLTYQVEGIFTTNFFGSKLAELGSTSTTDIETDKDAELYGMYNSITLIDELTVDVYVFYERDAKQRTSDAGEIIDRKGLLIEDQEEVKDQRVVHIGLRLDGALGGMDYNAEGVLQRGDHYGDEMKAHAIHAATGYTLKDVLNLRFGAEYNYATGDGDPTDGKNETFRQLYPTNYMHFGYINEFSWQNMHEVRGVLSFKPHEDVFLEFDYRSFWLADVRDNWYNAGRGINNNVGKIYTVGGTDENDPDEHVGSEIDFIAKYKYNKYVGFSGGYSTFIAGKYIKDQFGEDASGTSRRTEEMKSEFNHWAFVMVRLLF